MSRSYLCLNSLGMGPFLFQHDCEPVYKARSIKACMSEFGVEKLDWPVHRPDLSPTERFLDESEELSFPTSLSDLTNVLF